jgi:hypothetical protein
VSAQSRSTDDRTPSGDDADVAPRGVYQGVLTPSAFDESPPLSQMFIAPGPGKLRPNEDREVAPITMQFVPEVDPVVQSSALQADIPGPVVSFDAQSNISGVSPPDPNGDVGPNHIVTMSNLHFQIFNKTGTSVFGPAATNTLWAGFGGPCQTENAGDPVVLYDPISNRWMLSQFTSAGPSYFFCVAISTTPDPTGTYYRYAISTGSRFPDYPKAGVWPDAYYVSTREFTGSTFNGVGAYALNRAQAVAGDPSAVIISFLAPPSPSYAVGDGLLPSDLDGPTLPPSGSPNYFVGTQDNGGPYAAPSDAINIWRFTANFSTPSSSSFVLANTISVAPFDSTLALCSGRACIPQPATTNRLDHLGYRQRPLFRLAYRNFGTHESLVTNQSVDAGVGGPNNEAIAGIRWWEIRNPGGTPVVHQEGTFAPGLTDGIHRWMGSAAMNSAGSIALAYSAANDANPALPPSIRYTGRYPDSPLGTMPAGEGSIIDGTGSQTGGGSRWGDYTSLSVDPADDDTFWHVNEYIPTTSATGWRLRVGSFKLSTAPISSIIKGGAAIISAGSNNTIDPGETVTVTLGLRNLNVGAPGTICTSAALTATLQPGGGVTAPSGPQNYGALCTHGPTIYRQFTFTVDPSLPCGSTVTATLQLEDGALNLGTIPFQFVTGSAGATTVIPVENFDSVTAPALPAGWTPTASGSGTLPTTVTTFPDTFANTLFLSEATTQGLSEVASPNISVPNGETRLRFRLLHNTQANADGLVLEISINGAAFQDIEAAGGVFESGGYTGTLSTSASQPLPGRRAWSGLSGGSAAAPLYKSVVVKLPPAAAGQSVRFQWRQGSDGSVAPTSNPGSRVDTITLASTALFCGGNNAPSAVSAVSRKMHGAAGTFDIGLPLNVALTGPIAIEPRSGPAGEYQIVVTFANPVTVGGVTLTAGQGSATHTVSGTVVTINLTNVGDRQRVGLTLSSVNDGANIGSVPIAMGVLGGDVNVNNNVNATDIGQVKALVGAPVTGANFRADVATNGTISSSDVGLVKANAGRTIP